MKKITLIISMLALIVLVSNLALASAPAPAPQCFIEGMIKSVEFKEAYDEPCLTEVGGCPTDRELKHPARYYLDININSVTYLSGDESFRTCEDMFPSGVEQVIIIDKNNVKAGDSFKAGQRISGDVSTFFQKSFDIYDIEQAVVDNKDIDDKITNDKNKEQFATDDNTEARDSNTKTFIYAIVLVSIVVLVLSVYFLKKRRA